MEILFDRRHPNDLLEAIRLVQNMDSSDTHNISFYDSSTKDSELTEPVMILVDKKRKGLETTTEILFEKGFRVFALKLPLKNFDCFDLSVTVLGIWPKVLDILKTKKSPFIYTYKYSGKKLVKVRE